MANGTSKHWAIVCASRVLPKNQASKILQPLEIKPRCIYLSRWGREAECCSSPGAARVCSSPAGRCPRWCCGCCWRPAETPHLRQTGGWSWHRDRVHWYGASLTEWFSCFVMTMSEVSNGEHFLPRWENVWVDESCCMLVSARFGCGILLWIRL